MWDGSTVPLDENLTIAEQLLDKSVAARTILEIEIGAVGGEEDGHSAEINEKLYSTPADGVKVAQRLGRRARPVHGRVHVRQRYGSYKPGVVKLRPELLGDIQREAGSGRGGRAYRVRRQGRRFSERQAVRSSRSGGSGSRPEEIAEAVRYGVVKMNIDTDTQYAFTRAIADHVFSNYDAVLKVDGEVGEKAVRSALLGPRGRARWRPASWRPASSSVPPAKP